MPESLHTSSVAESLRDGLFIELDDNKGFLSVRRVYSNLHVVLFSQTFLTQVCGA